MLSVIEVRCPHCGARGQLMLPPLGSLIVGPCPECQELVLVFCGRVLPLDKETMMHGTFEQKHEHVMAALTSFLEERVGQLLMEGPADGDEEDEGLLADEMSGRGAATGTLDPPRSRWKGNLISSRELGDFVKVDLALIDNPAYFKAIFG